MVRVSSVAAYILMLFAVGSCTEPRRPALNATEAAQCKVRSGYQSRGGFGEPFCQLSYSDGGKTCTGKADCQGQCVSYMPTNVRLGAIPGGTPVAGQCSAEQSLFGCFALVEDGKLVGGYQCAD
jgi:hypothetical protein